MNIANIFILIQYWTKLSSGIGIPYSRKIVFTFSEILLSELPNGRIYLFFCILQHLERNDRSVGEFKWEGQKWTQGHYCTDLGGPTSNVSSIYIA